MRITIPRSNKEPSGMRSGVRSEVLPLGAVPHDDMAALYAVWLSARGSRRLPARGDFVPEDFASMIGRIVLFDVRREPLDFVCRLYGSNIRSVYNRDMTGRSLWDFQPADYRDALWRDYEEVARTGAPRLHRIAVYRDYHELKYDRLLLPLGADGETTNMILAASVYMENLAPLFEEK